MPDLQEQNWSQNTTLVCFTATTGTELVQLLPRFTRGYNRTGARPVRQDESLVPRWTPQQVAQATGCGSGIYHIGLEDLTREGAKQGLLSLLMAFSSSGQRRDVPDGCCYWKHWRSGRSGHCNRSSITEPGSGMNLLIYPWTDDITALLYSLSKMAVSTHKMAHLPFKMSALLALDVSGRSSVRNFRD